MASHDHPNTASAFQVAPFHTPNSDRASSDFQGSLTNAFASDRPASPPATPQIIPATPVLGPLDLGDTFGAISLDDLEAGGGSVTNSQVQPPPLASSHGFRRAGSLFRDALPSVRSINIFSSRSSTHSGPPPYDNSDPPQYAPSERSPPPPPPPYFGLHMPITIDNGRVRVQGGDWCSAASSILLVLGILGLIIGVSNLVVRGGNDNSQGNAGNMTMV